MLILPNLKDGLSILKDNMRMDGQLDASLFRRHEPVHENRFL